MDESILVGEKIRLVIYWPLNELTIFFNHNKRLVPYYNYQ